MGPATPLVHTTKISLALLGTFVGLRECYGCRFLGYFLGKAMITEEVLPLKLWPPLSFCFSGLVSSSPSSPLRN